MKQLLAVTALLFSVFAHAAAQPADARVSIGEVRSLAARNLAVRLLGPYVGLHVIEMERREYDSGTQPSIPQEITFYTQPTLTWPRVNGICATDVITVEFDWFEHQNATASTPLKLNHIEAKSRFKAFNVPLGEPGSPEYERLQSEECAKFATTKDSFSAPSAGDAQWLAAMEREYSRSSADEFPFSFACQDFADASCTKARTTLPNLALKVALRIEGIDCPPLESHDQVNFCYRLVFPYDGTQNPEWELTLVGGMSDGFAPQQIRALKLRHVPRPTVLN